MLLVGYAQVSTEDQITARQLGELRPWETVVRYLNTHQAPDAPRWTQERLPAAGGAAAGR
ncbi:MAG: hypothetical protein ACJ8AW_38445 [Rhodopila sp.]